MGIHTSLFIALSMLLSSVSIVLGCNNDEFQCASGQCINAEYKCDGRPYTTGCDDGSDKTPWGCSQGCNSIDIWDLE